MRQEIDFIFNPNAVAIIGASPDPEKAGGVVMRGLRAGKFSRPVLPVHPRHESVFGLVCYPSIASLPLVPELAVVCTAADHVAPALADLGRRGVRGAIVLTADPSGFGAGPDGPFQRAVVEAARSAGVRLLGPGSSGVQVPAVGLNVSLIASTARAGRLALVSQSGSLAAGVVDWASGRGIGFSHVVSAGDAADIDLADVVNHLAAEAGTTAILLYIRHIANSRKFLSAARAAARFKRVIVIKAGRHLETRSADAAFDIHPDEVFDAAVRRAGLLRVYSVSELFDAVETLASGHTVTGERLAILSNGSGPAGMAADTLIDSGGRLASLSEQTVALLRRDAPGLGAAANPLDIGRDATPDRFATVARHLLAAPGVDSVLVMHAPTPLAPAEATASALVAAAGARRRAVLACWMGHSALPEVNRLFGEAGIPLYRTPDQAARGFLHLVRYRHNQAMLLETPVAAPPEDTAGRLRVWTIPLKALGRGREILNDLETRTLLGAYGIAPAPTRHAAGADEAAAIAEWAGFPAAVRLAPADGVTGGPPLRTVLGLWSKDRVRTAVSAMLARFAEQNPGRPEPAVAVQRSSGDPGAFVLMAGIGVDPVFGPVIQFGAAADPRLASRDRAVALPPLNMHLAGELIQRTGIGRRLTAGDGPIAAAVRSLLVNLSRLVVDHPEIAGVSFEPVLADQDGVRVVHAAIRLTPTPGTVTELAIRPYPADLEEWVTLPDGGRVFLRPIRPEDTPAYERMLGHVSLEDMRLRFQGVFKSLPTSQLAALVHIDYDRDMTVVAMDERGGAEEMLGSVNILIEPGTRTGEYAVIVRSDQKTRKLGRVLMEKIIGVARQRALDTVVGLVQRDNRSMLALCRKLGFSVPSPCGLTDQDDMLTVTLTLG